MIDVSRFPDQEAMSRAAAGWIIDRIRAKPESLVCLASGATPVRTYQLLAEEHAANRELFARARVIKLDEWHGLSGDDPGSCERPLREVLLDALDLRDRYIGFDGGAADAQAECDRVAAWLARNGPIDLCILGLGINGHLGFNEPAPSLRPHAHVARLSEASLGHAMLQRARGRPSLGLTLGMADVLQAREGLLLVSGPLKKEPLQRLIAGPISTDFPASMLSMHRRFQIFWTAAEGTTPSLLE
jgi:galactosamine-6-phosphate isomerase